MKTFIRFSILSTILFILIMGCGEKVNTDTVEVFFQGLSAVTGSGGCTVDGRMNGGILIMGKQVNGPQKFSMILKDNCDSSASKIIDTNTNWKFLAYSWAGTTASATRCAYSTNFFASTQLEANVHFHLTSAECSNSNVNPIFSNTLYTTGPNTFKTPTVTFCDSFTEGNGTCTVTATAPSSYKIFIETDLGKLLDFGCSSALGSIPLLPDFPYIIESYGAVNCPNANFLATYSAYDFAFTGSKAYADAIRVNGTTMFVSTTILAPASGGAHLMSGLDSANPISVNVAASPLFDFISSTVIVNGSGNYTFGTPAVFGGQVGSSPTMLNSGMFICGASKSSTTNDVFSVIVGDVDQGVDMTAYLKCATPAKNVTINFNFIGSTATSVIRTITIKNMTGATLNTGTISSTNTNFSVLANVGVAGACVLNGTPIATGAGCTIKISYTPSAVGALDSDTLTLASGATFKIFGEGI